MNLGSSYLPLVNCRNLFAIKILVAKQGSVKKRKRNSGMPSSWSLKNCCKTARKMDRSRTLLSMPGAHLRLLLLLPMELPKQNQGIITILQTQCFSHRVLKPDARKATARAEVLIPNATREHLAWLPPLESLCRSVQWPQMSLLERGVQYVPIKPDWFPKLKKSFAFSCALYNFHFGSPPFQQQKRQEDSHRLLESVADNTLHLKFLLIFCLGTL